MVASNLTLKSGIVRCTDLYVNIYSWGLVISTGGERCASATSHWKVPQLWYMLQLVSSSAAEEHPAAIRAHKCAWHRACSLQHQVVGSLLCHHFR